MKKSVFKKGLGLTIVLAIVMQCFCGIVLADVTLTGDGTSDSPYQIGTYEQLVAFRDKVNGGDTSICAILTADIDVSAEASWTPIGLSAAGTDDTTDTDIKYTGTFDGDGHKITSFTVSGNYKGLFGYTEGATIVDLTIEGLVKEGGNGSIHGGHNGAIAGTAVGTTVANCKFIGSVTGFTDVCGFLGETAPAQTAKNTITNCVFIGDITATGVASGFARWYTLIKDSYFIGNISGGGEISAFGLWASVENCFAYGTVTANTAYAYPICAKNDTYGSYATNAYYLNATGVNGVDGEGTKASADDFASGKIAIDLGAAFGQTIGTDLYPVFATANNAVSQTSIGTYTNDTTENGTTVPYTISSYSDLAAFRNAVNAVKGKTTTNVILTKDIAIPEGVNWTPIGTWTWAAAMFDESKDAIFAGTFDGNGYKITNVLVNGLDPAWHSAFFRQTNGATIKNLTIEGNVGLINEDGSYTIDAYAGGLIGAASGTTITNCKFIGNVAANNMASGFIGRAHDCATADNIISNCAFIGNVTSGIGWAAGFAYRHASIENSYYIGDVTGKGEVSAFGLWSGVKNSFAYGTVTATGAVAYPISNGKYGFDNQVDSTAVSNCYYLNATGVNGVAGIGTQMSALNFESGQVAHLLGEAFGQTIGTDLYPVFATEDNAVIKTAVNTYTNDATENGTTVPYTIKTYTDLAEFRNTVNSKKAEAMSASVKLTKDIAIPEGTNWTPIGTWTWGAELFDTSKDAIFTGTFDGNGHKVTNVVVDGLDPTWYSGFFRQTDGATIKNLTVEGNVGTYSEDGKYSGYSIEAYAGGLIGAANNTTISNCTFIGNVLAGNTVGGFIGRSDKTTADNNITNCAFIGNVKNALASASGIAGKYVNVENSYVIGDIEGKGEVSGIGLWAGAKNCFVYGNVTATTNVAYPVSNGKLSLDGVADKNAVSNSYYLNATGAGGVSGYGTQMTEADFASGKIVYLLNVGAGEIVFGQTIGEDLYPVFFDNNMVYQNGLGYGSEGAFATIGANGVYVIASADTYVMVAQYAKEGDIETLLSVTPVNLTANQEYETAVTAADGADLYRVFVWNSVSDMKPVCSCAEYEVQ